MFENPRRGRQARNFSINVPKILDLKSSSEQIFSKIDVGCPVIGVAGEEYRSLRSNSTKKNGNNNNNKKQ